MLRKLIAALRAEWELMLIEEMIESDPWCAWANGYCARPDLALPHRPDTSPSRIISRERAPRTVMTGGK